MPIGHVSLPTGPSNYDEMVAFYKAALAPLGYSVYKEFDRIIGLQVNYNPDFWLHSGDVDLPRLTAATAEKEQKAKGRAHLAFNVSSRKAVDEWYRVAVKAGGVPNGEPGERPYVKGYYAAYVLDPVGNNIEAVFYNPLWLQALKTLPSAVAVLAGAGLAYAANVYFQR